MPSIHLPAVLQRSKPRPQGADAGDTGWPAAGCAARQLWMQAAPWALALWWCGLGMTANANAQAQAQAQPNRPAAEASPLQALPALAVAPYMGRWYQVAYYPNFFQRQCVSDTSATYRDLGDGTVEVLNRCRTSSGAFDQVVGSARPVAGASTIEAGVLQPARLEVSFLPRWLRWTGVGWGAYWVVDRPEHGRYAIVSEGRREYLWVLSRTAALSAEDRQTVRARLLALGFDLERLKDHPQEDARSAPAR